MNGENAFGNGESASQLVWEAMDLWACEQLGEIGLVVSGLLGKARYTIDDGRQFARYDISSVFNDLDPVRPFHGRNRPTSPSNHARIP